MIDDASGEIDVLLARATQKHVRSVIVAGREVVRDGVVQGVDYPGLKVELARQAAKAAPDIKAFQPILRRYQEAIRTYFRDGRHRDISS